MSDRVVTLDVHVAYDGQRTTPFIGGGGRWNFRVDTMPKGQFVTNLGIDGDIPIAHGDRGALQIRLIANDELLPELRPGAAFALHDGPSVTIAHGVIVRAL